MIGERGMRARSVWMTRVCWSWGIAMALGLLALAGPNASLAADDSVNAAHDLAEKFARAAGTRAGASDTTADSDEPGGNIDAAARAEAERRAADEQRAYEEDMLARARAEADARLKADMAREQEQARKRAELERLARQAADAAREKRRALEKAAADERARKEDEADRAAENARQRAEAERLAAAREREARELADRLRAARRAREDERARAAAEASTKAEQQAAARLQRARQSLRLRKERLAGRIAAIKAGRESRLARMRPPTDSGDAGISPITTGATPRATLPVANDTASQFAEAAAPHHATVLLVMEPGNRGIRRWKKTADPMLCIEGNCYISNGAASPARRISRRKGFGPGIALGIRAGACNNKLACVFRDVDLKGVTAWMQPIDLRIVRHDRREARRVRANSTCTATRSRVSCTRVIEGNGYRAWIIPEETARAAGPHALEDALEDDLRTDRIARSPHH